MERILDPQQRRSYRGLDQSCQIAPSALFLPILLALPSQPFLLPFLLTYFKMDQIRTISDQIFRNLQKGHLGLDSKMDRKRIILDWISKSNLPPPPPLLGGFENLQIKGATFQDRPPNFSREDIGFSERKCTLLDLKSTIFQKCFARSRHIINF